MADRARPEALFGLGAAGWYPPIDSSGFGSS